MLRRCHIAGNFRLEKVFALFTQAYGNFRLEKVFALFTQAYHRQKFFWRNILPSENFVTLNFSLVRVFACGWQHKQYY